MSSTEPRYCSWIAVLCLSITCLETLQLSVTLLSVPSVLVLYVKGVDVWDIECSRGVDNVHAVKTDTASAKAALER